MSNAQDDFGVVVKTTAITLLVMFLVGVAGFLVYASWWAFVFITTDL